MFPFNQNTEYYQLEKDLIFNDINNRKKNSENQDNNSSEIISFFLFFYQDIFCVFLP